MLVFGRPNRVLKKHAAARKPYEKWEATAEMAEWKSFAEMKAVRGDVDKVGRCYVFDIGGNNFRLITTITFATDGKPGIILINELLTHAEYDRGSWKGDC